MVLEDEPARQDEQSPALDALGVDRDDRDAEKIADGLEEKLFVHFPGVEDIGGPRTAVEIGSEGGGVFPLLDTAGEKDVDERFAKGRTHARTLPERKRFVMERRAATRLIENPRTPSAFRPA